MRWRDELTVGTGGAIVLDSDTYAEYDEMLLKAGAPLRALPLTTPSDLAARSDPPPDPAEGSHETAARFMPKL